MAKKKSAQSEIFLVKNIELIDIDDLVPLEKNPRNNDAAVEPVAAGIKEYGMLVPLVISKANEIDAGNTRYKACRLLGLQKVPCVRAEHLTPAQRKAFNVADNKLAEISTWNQDMLRDILGELQRTYETKFDPSLVGFQQAEYELLFQGWQSNAERMNDVKSDDSVAPGKIVIECNAEDEELIISKINELVVPDFEGISIR